MIGDHTNPPDLPGKKERYHRIEDLGDKEWGGRLRERRKGMEKVEL
jgi:hypothetical protein